jgi:hypothetical protein
MRVLNKKQLANIPMVDAGNLYLGMGAPDRVRDAIQRRELSYAQKVANNRRLEAERRRIETLNGERANQAHADMLKRSLHNSGRKVIAAAKKQGNGFLPQYGVKNAMLGFVDEVKKADFYNDEAIPAQDFNNALTAKDFAAYTQFKDFPLVEDARGDFGGILTNEKGSADFSTWIVDDAKTDFGYVPRRQLKRRR